MLTYLPIRILCFLAALTSGASLLLKVYGEVEMFISVPFIVVPCSIGLLLFWWLGKKSRYEDIAVAISIGVIGGLFSTFAYDLVRLPFHLFGYLVFATNSTYGMWVSDALVATRLTEVTGWIYHFSNGISFSIMYAVFMRGRHWIFAIAYAFALESIAIYSQFGQVFALTGNYSMISIAYLAHIAYALPIGIMVQNWEASKAWISNQKKQLMMGFVLFFLVFLIPVFTAEKVTRDAATTAGVFTVIGIKMLPFMQKIQKGETITIRNNNDHDIKVTLPKIGETYTITSGDMQQITFPRAGIFQLYVETKKQTKSSFVISEPVSEYRL